MSRYLVVANQTLGGPRLLTEVTRRIADDDEASFYVLVPATSRTGLYEGVLAAYVGDLPDQEEAVEAARSRLDRLLDWLHAAGYRADGEVGEDDPLLAVERACADNEFGEVILSTLPAGVSRWLSLDLVSRVRRAVDVPVTHVEGAAAPHPGEPLPPLPPPPVSSPQL